MMSVSAGHAEQWLTEVYRALGEDYGSLARGLRCSHSEPRFFSWFRTRRMLSWCALGEAVLPRKGSRKKGLGLFLEPRCFDLNEICRRVADDHFMLEVGARLPIDPSWSVKCNADHTRLTRELAAVVRGVLKETPLGELIARYPNGPGDAPRRLCLCTYPDECPNDIQAIWICLATPVAAVDGVLEPAAEAADRLRQLWQPFSRAVEAVRLLLDWDMHGVEQNSLLGWCGEYVINNKRRDDGFKWIGGFSPFDFKREVDNARIEVKTSLCKHAPMVFSFHEVRESISQPGPYHVARVTVPSEAFYDLFKFIRGFRRRSASRHADVGDEQTWKTRLWLDCGVPPSLVDEEETSLMEKIAPILADARITWIENPFAHDPLASAIVTSLDSRRVLSGSIQLMAHAALDKPNPATVSVDD